MKVIFLDFDGVLNSSASFLMESKKKKRLLSNKYRNKRPYLTKEQGKEYQVNKTFSEVAASNFQYILDQCPEVKIVISSTWRLIFTLDELKEQLEEYGIDSSRVVGVTPQASNKRFSQRAERGDDISEYLEAHSEVTDYVIIDDNSDMTVHMDKFVQTTWLDGLTMGIASTVIAKLGGKANGKGLPL